jgi:predicted AAA+ superfamily ATPase
MIYRTRFIQQVETAFASHKIVAILGPRQCGKSTLARFYGEVVSVTQNQNYFDLERPSDLARLQEPELVLSQLSGLIIIDEIQEQPELFKTLRALHDDPSLSQRYLLLGSASRELLLQSSETLAGRIVYLELTPFNLSEVDNLDRLWERGGFPKSYLAEAFQDSFLWREHYIRTYLELEIRRFGIEISPLKLHQFWTMLAYSHGNIFNAAQLAQSLGVSAPTVSRYLDILHHTFMVRILRPFSANLNKRQVKSPKVYLRDSGILHALLQMTRVEQLQLHPKLGSSWEGFALEQVIATLGAQPENCFFWAVHSQAELDLLVFHEGKKLGFEFKYSKSPVVTNSMRQAIDALALDSLTVIYPGDHPFPLAEKITAMPLSLFSSKN